MNARNLSILVMSLLLLVMAQSALAAGPHDENCVSCHNVHYAKGNYIIGPQPNTKMDNPAAKSKTSGIDSLCLGCHNDAEGIIPIHLATTHPVGVAPIHVKVPAQLLRDGKLSCVSCHNPHPSNTNYKYLIVDTQNGTNMGVFCATCHTDQAPADVRKAQQASVINSDINASPRVPVQALAAAAKAGKAAKTARTAK